MIYLWLFLEFLKVGLFTFGGGYAMIPLIKETVLNHGWMEEGEFFNFIGLCEATPGPIAVNMASFVGFSQGGVLGAVVATFGVVLPSFVIIVLVASLLKHVMKKKVVKGFFVGVKPVIVGLIAATGILMLFKSIGFQSLQSFEFDYVPVAILLSLFALMGVYRLLGKKVNNILLIVIAAGLGILFSIAA